jgi:hypothetical protein
MVVKMETASVTDCSGRLAGAADFIAVVVVDIFVAFVMVCEAAAVVVVWASAMAIATAMSRRAMVILQYDVGILNPLVCNQHQ